MKRSISFVGKRAQFREFLAALCSAPDARFSDMFRKGYWQ